MARILYAVHGTGHGHAMRGLTIARAMPQHEFLFVGGDDAPGVLEAEFPVERIPNIGTVFKNYRVDLAATLKRAVPLILRRGEQISRVLQIIEKFAPDICITDLEYFTPRAAEQAGIPCLTLDHQHVITLCEHDLPRDMLWDFHLQGLTPKHLFRPTAANLLISFYRPPLLPRFRANTVIAPPILRKSVLTLAPEDRGHVVVYQSNSTDRALIEFLQTATKRECHVFGYINEERKLQNVHFHKKDEEGFLRLLEGCAYVIMGGSHTLMGEALFLKKPVLSLPLQSMIEQRLNSFYLAKLGYGMQAGMSELSVGVLERFEARLPEFAATVAQGEFCGNDYVFGLVDRFAVNGSPDFVKRQEKA